MLYQGQIHFLSPFKERGLLYMTESGPPAQSILSYVLEVAGWPARLGLAITHGPLSRASASPGGPEAQPRPHATGELNKASRKP